MRCTRRVDCLAGLSGLSGTGLGCIELRRGGRLAGLGGSCLSLSVRLRIRVCLSRLRRLLRLNRLRLNRLLRRYLRGRLSGLLRLSCVTRLSGQRSVLCGTRAGIIAVTTGCTLRRVVGSVLRH